MEPTLLMLGSELAGTLLLNQDLPTTGSESPESGSILTLAAADSTATTESGLLALSLDILSPLNSDEDGETIVITGWRPPIPEVTDGGNGTSGGGGGAGDGGDSGSDSEPDANDCRDRAALASTEEINSEGDHDTEEHGSVIYVGADGKVHHSPPIEGDELGISMSQLVNWMTANGVSMSQVIGFVHNHPALVYGGTPELMALNRYPSVGASGSGDWTAAEYMVNRGAGGPSGANFALYIIDTVGKVREFAYSDREAYESLTQRQRENGVGLPDELVNDGTSCE